MARNEIEVLPSGLLALPDPQQVTLARLPETLEQSALLRALCREEGRPAVALELHRRMMALDKYLTDREARPQILREARRTELLLGDLLGPPERGGDRRSNTAPVFDPVDIQPNLKVDFRTLRGWAEGLSWEEAEARLERLLLADVDRSKLLTAIERERLTAVAEAADADAALEEEEPLEEPIEEDENESDLAEEEIEEALVEELHAAGLFLLDRADISEAKELVEPGSIDVIITDPPYVEEALDVYAYLADFALHGLREGGSLVVMVGQFHFPRVLADLTASGLNYQWLLAYLTPGGQSVQVFPRNVNTFWKPVIWLTKGKYDGKWIGDVTRSDVNDNDKTRHRWGQSESGMADIVRRLSVEGDLVCDPFCGGGTTGVVSVQLGRRFLGFDIDDSEVAVAKGRLIEATA